MSRQLPRRAQRPLYAQPVSIDRSIDDDEKSTPPSNSQKPPELQLASSSSVDRSGPPAKNARLTDWLERHGIRGAAGMVSRHGARAVLDALYDMLIVDQVTQAWTIDSRFNNASAFLNWSLTHPYQRRKTTRTAIRRQLAQAKQPQTAREQTLARMRRAGL